MAYDTGHRVQCLMVLLVEDPAAGSELLLRLPIVGSELEDEELWLLVRQEDDCSSLS